MRAVGLITEYNPFHNGHLYHLRESLRLADADVAVAVMSGHFLQRGEAALVDKWARTEMALAAGVDVVVELPLPWACNSASHFAEGAIHSLQRLGGVDRICFGSESGDVDRLQRCATFLHENEAAIEADTRPRVRQGLTWPAARAAVVEARAPDSDFSRLLQTPNNILGLSYLRALLRTGADMLPLTIRRIGAGYHGSEVIDGIASATGIRQRLANDESVSGLLPGEVHDLLQKEFRAGRVLEGDALFRLVAGRLLLGAGRMPDIYQFEPGMETTLCRAAQTASDLEGLLMEAKPRHLTRTRLQRLLCYLLLDLTNREMDEALEHGPLYLHLLGVSPRGMKFLSRRRKQRQVPLVQNYSRVHAQLARFYGRGSRRQLAARRQLDLELRASRIYTLAVRQWTSAERNRDFTEELRWSAQSSSVDQSAGAQ